MKWLATGLALLLPGPAFACRLALALALDVSGSVDNSEYEQQMRGLAAALADPEVEQALFADPGAPVSVAVFEWSASRYQRLVQNWLVLEDRADLQGLIARLNGWTREPSPEPTGLGAALRYGHALLERAPACWQQTLDVSGDGENNDWPAPQDLRRAGALGQITINGLLVSAPRRKSDRADTGAHSALLAYFEARVIQGPDAFVEVAFGYGDYARAMKKKLLRELATRPVGSLWPERDRLVRRQ